MQDYKFTDRLLHKLALGIPLISEMTFDFEKLSISPKVIEPKIFYVTGLARSGTTMFMRALYSTDSFASLTYNDMPFVLSPNIWGKFTSFYSKSKVLKERAHGDGIQVSFDSPEAFEEVFWRLQCGDKYIDRDFLKVHNVSQEVFLELRKYHKLICHKYSKNRYLSKNNNFLLRIDSISRHDPEITFLVMFRNPVDQAKSLLKQHKRFEDSDIFTKDYMNWLVHHEFGDTHKPFQFGDNTFKGSMNEIDYWLNRWIDAYSYLLKLLQDNKKNIIPICYETLCSNPNYWENLCTELSLDKKHPPFLLRNKDSVAPIDSTLVQKSLKIYSEINFFTKKYLCA